jgi:hypothetical protein
MPLHRLNDDMHGDASMRKFLFSAMVLHMTFWIAIAQPASAADKSLSLDQQNKLSEIVADQTPQPLTNVGFTVARDVVVPDNIPLQPLPVEAEKLDPQLHGYSYLAVEELVAIVDTNSRKIVSVMQRMRRQERSK